MATNKNIKINLDYSDFSGGIKECQSKMSLLNNQFKMQQAQMGNNASEIDKLSLSQSTLNQKIQLQSQIVAQARERWETMVNSEDASLQQTERAHMAWQKASTTLANLKNELDATTSELEQLSNAEEEAGDSAEGGSEGVSTFAAELTSTISIASSLVAGIQQVSESIANLATESTQWADDLMTLSAQIGVSTTTLQEWQYASDFVDVSMETMSGSLTKLTKNMASAQDGTGTAAEAFKQLGVSITDSHGNLRSSEQVFYEVIDALGGIQNQAERDSTAMAIFGKSATELNGLIEQGSGALNAYAQEAEQLGIIMGEQEVSALGSMNDSFDKLSSVIDAAGKKASSAFAPALAALADKISTMNPNVLALVAGAGSLLTVFGSLAPVLQSVASITSLVTTAKVTATTATVAETAAETSLTGAAIAADAALLPQIAIAVALLAAFAALAYGIEKLIDLFNKEADAADRASASTENFANASNGAKSSSGTSTSGTKHYALGGRVSGGQVWVGEQGAELVDLPAGSYVHNSTDSRNMSTSNVFNVTIDAKNVDDFNKVVKVFEGLPQSMNRGNKVYG